MTGAQMVVKMLEKNGVDTVFGYPGAANCPLIDKISESDSIKHILVRSEQGAAHMASGYACVKAKVGVCTATSGPGATNLITGIATAYMDSVPMVALTGQVATPLIGKDAFQEVDITGATIPFTKHNYLVKDIKDIPRIVNDAFYIAGTGRPGPVLIDLPMDILKKEYKFPDEMPEINIRGYRPVGKANEAQVRKAADALQHAKMPIILAGGGIVSSGATEAFRKFVEMTNIPVVSTMMGIGTIPTDDKHYYGMVGSHGIKQANLMINKADLVLVIGARLGDRAVYNAENLEKKSKMIHIDIDPAEIGKNMHPYIPIVGDVGDVLSQLMPHVTDYKVPEEWTQIANEILSKCQKPAEEIADDGFVNPKYFLKKLAEYTNSEVYVSTEVGQNQIWVSNNFTFRDPRRLITSGGFGTMGYGLPAAIGASKASGDTVIAVMGDGSFQMDLMEMATMQQWDIPVKMVLFQNNRLGMVHEHQFMLYNQNYQAVTLEGSPDFCKLADAYGIASGRISQNSEVDEGIRRLMDGKQSYLLVIDVDPKEPTGGSLNERRM